MSDIHGNIMALNSVLNVARQNYDIQGCVILGDVIDYGMHSNEVADILGHLQYPVLCCISGNHEYAVLNKDYGRLSSDRGRRCAQYTESILSDKTRKYIKQNMAQQGMGIFEYRNKKCLAVHGSLEDSFWESIHANIAPGDAYKEFDYVFSGHSHIPHFFETYYETENISTRNKKKVIFINPGSVGQPRNLNNMAQFAVLDFDTEKVVFEKAAYDISYEQRAIKGCVDDFYSERLERGI